MQVKSCKLGSHVTLYVSDSFKKSARVCYTKQTLPSSTSHIHLASPSSLLHLYNTFFPLLYRDCSISSMADHKDQRMIDPLEEDPTFIPSTKTSMAAKSLPGSHKESKPELESNDDEDMIDQFVEDSKKQKLNEQQRRAFYSVLLAFRAETLSSGNKRTQIIEKLMSEWSIAQETLVSFEDNIEKNLVAHQERVDSEAKETKEKPLTIRLPVKQSVDLGLFITKLQAKKPTLCSSWGRVNPEALVGRRVCVRMPGEDEFEVLVIKEFNAKDGTHRLATVDPNVMWLNEALSWMDVRKVPDEDIRWKNGEKPDFETPPGSGAGQ
ncbi:unnamed protein product [Brassica oleracea var. botrytis]|nr:hypothetical protein HID58_060751 [Brassica napus]CAF1848556.1 unnamed protein product [Brassica napus]VDD09552.1 unnamed protein product [Brassica oleracea]